MDLPYREVWRIINRLRESGVDPEPEILLKMARDQGISLEMEQIRAIRREYEFTNHGPPDELVISFMTSYLEENPPNTVLDIWVGIGQLLAPIVETFNPRAAIGVTRYANEHEGAPYLNPRVPIDWRLADQLLLLDDLATRFDVVLGAPPWNWKPDTMVLDSSGGPVSVRDYTSNLIILKASTLLEPGGVGLFIVPQSFTVMRRKQNVYASLSRLGLFVDAALSLPGGHFEPVTSLPGLLIVVRREKPAHLFIGELSSEASGTLLRNLKSRKEGKVPQLGALVDQEVFRSFPALVATRQIEKDARSLGFPAIALKHLASEINLANSRVDDGFKDKPNSVYLPLIGRSAAVTALAEMHMKPQNYAQLVLDSDKAVAPYVANFFNTALGQRIRDSLLSSGVIQRINKSILREASVYVPNLELQAETLRVQSILTNLSTQLENYHHQLWRQPRRASEIERALKSLNREDTFEPWMETLPFPLASILWAYHADSEAERQAVHLFNFFEALSEFTATILLSAYAADKSFYAQQSGQWIEEDPKYRDWYLASTFGGWNTLGARLAKVTRRLLDDSQKRERCLDLFGRPEVGFIEMLASKRLFNILDEALYKRNNWKAHGGIVSPQEAKRRLTLLESDLSRLREVISDWYTTTLLLSPEDAEYREEVFRYRVKALMGSRTIFKQLLVTTLGPMDSSKLYLTRVAPYRH